MSGGVDSSVAAALLIEQGYEVIGVSMNLFTCNRPIERSCCSAEDRADARAVCERLGIKHHLMDCRPRFKDAVIDTFVDEYLRGRTPSPCILCNKHLKFDALFEEADRLGSKFVATGHYARIENDGERYRLRKGSDEVKDQSYFLFTLTQNELARLVFPVGEMTKGQVRAHASKLGLLVHDKRESQEICFVPEDDYTAFVEEMAGGRLKGPGNFVDMEGRVVGHHKGIHAYTIGQRRGIGFGMGKRQYVIRIDADRNEVVLGASDDLLKGRMLVRNVSWVSSNSADIKEALVKIRSAHSGERAALDVVDGNEIRVRFKRPVRAIAPGQAAVFYIGDEVLGGGWIV